MNRIVRKRLAAIVLWSSSAVAVLLGTTTWASRKQSLRITVLSPSTLRTDASPESVQNAIIDVCRDIENGHARDRSILVADTNTIAPRGLSAERANTWGEYEEGSCRCKDRTGNSIQIRWYREPRIGTLITCECGPGLDPQPIADAIQRALVLPRK